MKLSKEKIRIIQARMQVSQKKLAGIAGVCKPTLSYAINGRECRPELAGKIANALGVDVTEILED